MDHNGDVNVSFGGEPPQLRDGVVLGVPSVELVAANDVLLTLEQRNRGTSSKNQTQRNGMVLPHERIVGDVME
jgi:hypothetical protein